MKVIAQGDPIEYEVEDAAQACQLYRKDMTAALIGVVTHVTDYERAKRNADLSAESARLVDANKRLLEAYDQIAQKCEAAYSALRSYQYGNSAPDLAAHIADHLRKTLDEGKPFVEEL